eukprot:PhM_4_TR17291/c0_g1_i1/m.63963/K06691/RPN13; 26S proteasome regulatory subunit N13
MPTNLFAQPGGPGGSTPIVQFRAGKMTLSGNTVTADKRKGLVQLVEESGALVLKWIDRSTNRTEDSIYLFPGQATYARVPQCTTGRVYLLNFLDCNRQVFFWMQEPKEDKDTEYCDTISKKLGASKASTEATSGSNNNSNNASAAATAPNNRDNNAEMAVLRQLLGSSGSGNNSNNNTTQQQLLNLLGGGGAAAGATAPRTWDVSLSQLVSGPEVLEALRQNPQHYAAALRETLPVPPAADGSDIVSAVRNPQLGSTAGLLQEALRDPAGFRELCTAFNVRVPANGLPSVLDFLEAICKEQRDDKQ